MGNVYSAHLNLKSPFDPKNRRVQGDYAEAIGEPEAATAFLQKHDDAMNQRNKDSMFSWNLYFDTKQIQREFTDT